MLATRGAGGARAAAVARAQRSLSCIFLLRGPRGCLARAIQPYELYVLSVFDLKHRRVVRCSGHVNARNLCGQLDYYTSCNEHVYGRPRSSCRSQGLLSLHHRRLEHDTLDEVRLDRL